MRSTTSFSPVVQGFRAVERRARRRGEAPTVQRMVAAPLATRRGGPPGRWVARPGRQDLAVHTHELPTGGSVMVYVPETGAGLRPGVIHVHGGGWVTGSAPGVDAWSRRIADGVGAVVVSVDYRLAPEHRYPDGLDDCVAALQWLRQNAAELSVDPARLAVTGDSAGGNLAAAVALHDRDAGTTPALASQVLVYPAVDLTVSDPWLTSVNGSGITQQDCVDLVAHYLPEGLDPTKEPLASPWHAPSLAGLPPALVLTAGNDVLREQGRRYAERLTSDGGQATWIDYRGMPHGFFGADRLVLSARRAQAAAMRELTHRLAE